MPTMSLLNQAKGPLPITVNFSAPSDGASFFGITGSVWSQTANVMIGVGVELDGKPIGSASIFSNGASTHRNVVPSYIPANLAFGKHTLTLVPLTGSTISDVNDLFDVILLY